MSQYVRTKNGITREEDLRATQREYKARNLSYDVEEVAQADTIKELCDMYVVEFIAKNQNEILRQTFKTLIAANKWKDAIGIYGDKYIALYGAIWTGYGCIYVAKMNNKGKLELLEA